VACDRQLYDRLNSSVAAYYYYYLGCSLLIEVTLYLLTLNAKRNSKGYDHIFGVNEVKCTIADTVRCNRKSEIQVGGRQTGSTYIWFLRRLKRNTKLQRLHQCFLGSAAQWEEIVNTAHANRKWDTQDCDHKTGISVHAIMYHVPVWWPPSCISDIRLPGAISVDARGFCAPAGWS